MLSIDGQCHWLAIALVVGFVLTSPFLSPSSVQSKSPSGGFGSNPSMFGVGGPGGNDGPSPGGGTATHNTSLQVRIFFFAIEKEKS